MKKEGLTADELKRRDRFKELYEESGLTQNELADAFVPFCSESRKCSRSRVNTWLRGIVPIPIGLYLQLGEILDEALFAKQVRIGDARQIIRAALAEKDRQ